MIKAVDICMEITKGCLVEISKKSTSSKFSLSSLDVHRGGKGLVLKARRTSSDFDEEGDKLLLLKILWAPECDITSSYYRASRITIVSK